METVVLHSDIARLVLAYLKGQRLERVAHSFCKSSVFLKEEFSIYKQGFQPHSFFPELEEIICEYVKTSQKVEEVLKKLPAKIQIRLQSKKLSEKVIYLTERTCEAVTTKNSTKKRRSGSSAYSRTVHSPQSSNASKRRALKRKRKSNSLHYSPNSAEENCSFNESRRKRQRVCTQFVRLGYKQLRLIKKKTCSSSASTDASKTFDESCVTEPECDTSDNSVDETVNEEDVESLTVRVEDNFEDDKLPKVIKESIPKIPDKNYKPPSVPELSQVILENSDFQTKLVNNINQVLQQTNLGTINTIKNNTVEKISNYEMQENMDDVPANDILDRMVKNILEATEKDPAFDAIINEIVGRPTSLINTTTTEATVATATTITTTVPTLPTITTTTTIDTFSTDLNMETTEQQQQQQQQMLVTSTNSNNNNISINNTKYNQEIPPCTPLIIRNAVAGQDPQDSSNVNTSFNLVDPNFSISKLLVFNECGTQKSDETILDGISLDSLIGQIVNNDPTTTIGSTTSTTNTITNTNDTTTITLSNNNTALEGAGSFDANNGLTFPVLIINDGIYPLYLSNDTVKQMEDTIILNNDGTLNAIETTNLTNINNPSTSAECSKPQPTIRGECSLQKQLVVEARATPVASGIVNVKAIRSLSTPRKSASHVRTLTFSPRSMHSRNLVDATPLTHRHEFLTQIREQQRAFKAVSDTSNKPIIDQVEILSTATTATTTTDSTATTVAGTAVVETTNIDNCIQDSNSSSNMAPLLTGNDEISNQTVIALNTNNKEEKQIRSNASICSSAGKETPMRRTKSRKMAMRLCKRQLSKSPPIENVGTTTAATTSTTTSTTGSLNTTSTTMTTDSTTTTTAATLNSENKIDLMKENEKNQQNTTKNTNSNESISPVPDTSAENTTTECKDSLMKEWLRMRQDNKRDLDSRLREINVKMGNTTSASKTTKKTPRRRKRPEMKRKEILAAEKAAKELDDNADELKEMTNGAEGENKVVVMDFKQVESKKETNAAKKKLGTKNSTKEVKVKLSRVQMATDTKSDTKTVQHKIEEVVVETSVALNVASSNTNMASLLDTPFKRSSPTNLTMPPTPGCCPIVDNMNAKTPAVKVPDLSTSYLFGSLSKSELNDTPILSAITPGFRFTPFCAQEATPRSDGRRTDYSSGGGSSYYKPDESEDVELNLDKMLKESAQKRLAESQTQSEDEKEPRQMNSICVEIPIERVKVERNLLKRVKSFSAELKQNLIEEHAEVVMSPHYTLAAGLPEISAAEENSDTTCSSSSSSSSSSSNSVSSSSSGSSSSSSSSSNSNSVTSIKSAKIIKETVAILDEQLSEISSAEDEEWQKQQNMESLQQESTQLVNTDGEVRYPVRSWLTPCKEQTGQAMKVTLPIKCTEKRLQQQQELERKRERMKEKLKRDSAQQKPKETVKLRALSGSGTRRDVGGKLDKPKAKAKCTQSPQRCAPPPEMLNALNLSAKKPTKNEVEQITGTAVVGAVQNTNSVVTDIDENAMSTVFADAKSTTTTTTTTTIPKENNFKGSECLRKTVETPSARQAIRIEPKPKTTRGVTKKDVKNTLGVKKSTKLARTTPKKYQSISKGKKGPAAPKPTKASKASNIKRQSPRLAKSEEKLSAISKAILKPNTPTIKTNIKFAHKKEHGLPFQPKSKSIAQKNTENNATSENKITKELVTTETVVVIRNDSENELIKDKGIVESMEKNSKNPEPLLSNEGNILLPNELNMQVVANTDLEAISETEEEEIFELVSITETDTKRFKTIVYEGSDNGPELQDIKYEFSNIVVAIDENEKHTWSVSENICLFESPPTDLTAKTNTSSLRTPRKSATLPKKRKIRVISNSESEETQELPSATSTPVFKIVKNSTAIECRTETNLHDITAESIKIDDIESILSHLHGT